MKLVSLVLLVAAIGVGAYFYFTKKQSAHSLSPRELIVGTWKADSLIVSRVTDTMRKWSGGSRLTDDTSLKGFDFEFKNDGHIFQTSGRQIRDTSLYTFTDPMNILVWSTSDTVKTKFLVGITDSSHMTLRSSDGAVFYFRRAK